MGRFGKIQVRKIKDRFRWQRSTAYSLNAVILSFLVLILLGFINFLGVRHYKRFDFTEEKLFSLSSQSIKVVKALKEDVVVTGFFQPDQKPAFDELVNKYTYHSPKIKVSFVDPDKEMAITKKYDVKRYGTIILEQGKRETRIEGLEEEKFTNALIKVGKEKSSFVYVLKGHQEKEISDQQVGGYSQLKTSLENEGYGVKDFVFLETKEVPKDADVLLIAGPMLAFAPQEITWIEAYLAQGGRVIFLVDPESKKAGLERLLKSVGVDPKFDHVIDPISKLFGQDAASPAAFMYGSSVMTEDLERQKVPTIFPLVQSLKMIQPLPKKELKVDALVKSSPNSWGETSPLGKGNKVKFDDKVDERGPLNLGVMVEEKNESGSSKKKMRCVIFGDSDFVSNQYLGHLGNENLFLNVVAWLAEDEALISIRPKSPSQGRFLMTARQAVIVGIVTIVVLPLIILVSGVLVWLRRRRYA